MLKLAYPDEIAKLKGLTETVRRRTCTTAAPATSSSVRSLSAMHFLKLHHLVDDKMHARSTGRTRSSRSNRWAARRSSVASVSVKWKCGRSKPTALPTSCRRC